MCDTGHMHVNSLAYDECRHHHYYMINLKLSLAEANATFVYQTKVDFQNRNYLKTYLKM